jgi:hypothetical protein
MVYIPIFSICGRILFRKRWTLFACTLPVDSDEHDQMEHAPANGL